MERFVKFVTFLPRLTIILIYIYHQDFSITDFFYLILLFHLIFRTTLWHNVAEKHFIIWYSWFDFIELKEFIVDSINYLGWESNFSIRPPRVFKILSTKFQWTQTIEKDSVERSAYAVIIVNHLYVAGSNLGH